MFQLPVVGFKGRYKKKLKYLCLGFQLPVVGFKVEMVNNYLEQQKQFQLPVVGFKAQRISLQDYVLSVSASSSGI